MALDNTKSTTSTDPNKGSAPVVPPKKTGEINGKQVEVADNQTSKGWYVLAIAIGTLFIAVGVFGVIGLLHAHGVVLPQWLQGLTPIIGAVGNTPHFWSLWAIASVGAVAGSGLIAFGAIKIHQARTEDAQSAPKPDVKKNDSTPVPGNGPKVQNQIPEKDLEVIRQRVASKFQENNFDGLGVDPEDFEELDLWGFDWHEFETRQEGLWVPEKRLDRYFIVRKTPEGKLECTGRLTQQEKNQLYADLKKISYYDVGPFAKSKAERELELENLANTNKGKVTAALEKLDRKRVGASNAPVNKLPPEFMPQSTHPLNATEQTWQPLPQGRPLTDEEQRLSDLREEQLELQWRDVWREVGENFGDYFDAFNLRADQFNMDPWHFVLCQIENGNNEYLIVKKDISGKLTCTGVLDADTTGRFLDALQNFSDYRPRDAVPVKIRKPEVTNPPEAPSLPQHRVRVERSVSVESFGNTFETPAETEKEATRKNYEELIKPYFMHPISQDEANRFNRPEFTLEANTYRIIKSGTLGSFYIAKCANDNVVKWTDKIKVVDTTTQEITDNEIRMLIEALDRAGYKYPEREKELSDFTTSRLFIKDLAENPAFAQTINALTEGTYKTEVLRNADGSISSYYIFIKTFDGVVNSTREITAGESKKVGQDGMTILKRLERRLEKHFYRNIDDLNPEDNDGASESSSDWTSDNSSDSASESSSDSAPEVLPPANFVPRTKSSKTPQEAQAIIDRAISNNLDSVNIKSDAYSWLPPNRYKVCLVGQEPDHSYRYIIIRKAASNLLSSAKLTLDEAAVLRGILETTVNGRRLYVPDDDTERGEATPLVTLATAQASASAGGAPQTVGPQELESMFVRGFGNKPSFINNTSLMSLENNSYLLAHDATSGNFAISRQNDKGEVKFTGEIGKDKIRKVLTALQNAGYPNAELSMFEENNFSRANLDRNSDQFTALRERGMMRVLPHELKFKNGTVDERWGYVVIKDFDGKLKCTKLILKTDIAMLRPVLERNLYVVAKP
jgi:hypothetical protein